MSVIAAALRELMAAGIEGDALISAIERIEAAQTPTVTARQARNRRYYTKRKEDGVLNRLNSDDQDDSDAVSPKTKRPPTPPKKTQPLSLPPSVPTGPHGSVTDLDFEMAWKAYPHRRGRSSKPKSLIAWKALPKADKPRLLEAIRRYAAEGYEPRADCGAKAFELWLRDQRYLDWLEDKTGPPEMTQAEKDAEDERIIAEGALKIAQLTGQIAKDSQLPPAGRNGGGLRGALRG